VGSNQTSLPEDSASLQSSGLLTVEEGVYQFLPKAWNVLNKIGFSLVP